MHRTELRDCLCFHSLTCHSCIDLNQAYGTAHHIQATVAVSLKLCLQMHVMHVRLPWMMQWIMLAEPAADLGRCHHSNTVPCYIMQRIQDARESRLLSDFVSCQHAWWHALNVPIKCHSAPCDQPSMSSAVISHVPSALKALRLTSAGQTIKSDLFLGAGAHVVLCYQGKGTVKHKSIISATRQHEHISPAYPRSSHARRAPATKQHTTAGKSKGPKCHTGSPWPC